MFAVKLTTRFVTNLITSIGISKNVKLSMHIHTQRTKQLYNYKKKYVYCIGHLDFLRHIKIYRYIQEICTRVLHQFYQDFTVVQIV